MGKKIIQDKNLSGHLYVLFFITNFKSDFRKVLMETFNRIKIKNDFWQKTILN